MGTDDGQLEGLHSVLGSANGEHRPKEEFVFKQDIAEVSFRNREIQ